MSEKIHLSSNTYRQVRKINLQENEQGDGWMDK